VVEGKFRLKQMPSRKMLESFLSSVLGGTTTEVVFDTRLGKLVWLDTSNYIETKEDRNTKTP